MSDDGSGGRWIGRRRALTEFGAVGATGLAGCLGFGGGGGTTDATPESTEAAQDGTANAGSSGGESGNASETTAANASTTQQSGPPFTFTVQSIENCGTTCRDVTVKLTNNTDQTAKNVEVYTRIFAGKTTKQGAKIFEERRQVGDIPAGGSKTETTRVKLSYSEGFKVQQNDGWITILTTVSSEERTFTFKQQRDVR